jgi:hypothetical protein
MGPVEVARTEDAKARFAKVKQVHLRALARRRLVDVESAHRGFTNLAWRVAHRGRAYTGPVCCWADEASRTPRDAMLQVGGVRLSLVVTVGSFADGASFSL